VGSKLFTGSFTSFSSDLLPNKADPFTFVWLGRPVASDFGCNLTDELLIIALELNDGGFTPGRLGLNFDFRRHDHHDGVRKSEGEGELIALRLCPKTKRLLLQA
jgi:hypothetical protein